MKHAINTIFSGTGLLIFCIGFIMCVKAAGCSDFDAPLDMVGRYAFCGVTACLCGLFVHRWHV